MTTPTPKVSEIQKLLQGLGASMSDPNQAGTMGLAQGLLAASAPHMLTPVSMGQAMGMGTAQSQAYQQAALQNAIQREAMLPFQVARTKEFQQALANQNNPNLTPQQRADNASIGLQFAGIKPNEVPGIAGQIARQQTLNQFHTLGPNARGYGPPLTQDANAQGTLPMGSVQGPAPGTPGGPPLGSLNLSLMPGAANAIQGAAANQSYGSSQGSLPAQVAAARAAPKTLAPGTTLGSMNAGNGMAPKIARMVGAGVAQGAPAPKPQSPTASPASGPGVRTGMSLSTATGQKANQEQATTAMNADISATKERQQRVANLEELNAVASGLKTGPGMDAHVAVLKALESIPGAIGLSAGKLQTITNAQIFNKTALNLSLQTVSSAGQHAYDAFKSVMNAFPELSKTPLANAVVTGSLLATARYEADKSKFAANWQQANGMGYVQGKGSYDATWAKNASFLSYFLNALPPAARQELFQKARTNATLRHEINQAVKSNGWLKANGY